MNLWDAICAAAELEDDLITICATKPWTPDSDAEFVKTDEGRIPASVNERGLDYFLEVFVMREILAPYVEKKPRTQKEQFDFVVHYAENDSYPDE
jgi:hypothetical protein